ncbi:hypothetical protein DFH06DRAFT_1136019 [Mycena polygramma]|nr:hypothetical protein DFH06DRAFT_1136019 [Mycena polygramma]
MLLTAKLKTFRAATGSSRSKPLTPQQLLPTELWDVLLDQFHLRSNRRHAVNGLLGPLRCMSKGGLRGPIRRADASELVKLLELAGLLLLAAHPNPGQPATIYGTGGGGIRHDYLKIGVQPWPFLLRLDICSTPIGVGLRQVVGLRRPDAPVPRRTLRN